ncbi:hypothetical protein BS47DRAFT_1097858 [Hydnum rufescens UP504]|uniref:Uncharacterized protein n=1 Tax=Hydnum rufescens UP504 TaxID=1448309 RepID=A0A9P6AUW9_9AGAM|nr:hypothetical protein BS47DRAFT_1097858 [Hydnum rufescens UP504]
MPSSLHGLIQVIYQGDSRFILVSREDLIGWTLDLGLVGSARRKWWRSVKQLDEVKELIDYIISGIAGGQLYIKGWKGDEIEELELAIYPASDNPLSFSLNAYTTGESEKLAEEILFEIGSQLRHHGSRFIPLTSTKNMDNSSDTEKDASEEITQLRTDLAKSQEKVGTTQAALARFAPPKRVASSLPKLPKNLSKGNPLGKKRTIEQMEFESDSEDERKDQGSSSSGLPK